MTHDTARVPDELFLARPRLWGEWKSFISRDQLASFLEAHPEAVVKRAKLVFEPVDTAEYRRPMRVYRVLVRYQDGSVDTPGPAYEICANSPWMLDDQALAQARLDYPTVPWNRLVASSPRVAKKSVAWGPKGSLRKVRDFTPPA
ncbi:hypothetical protein OG689_41870 [Kitasatospora sp. NBC_00240]|uniref:hypothetical protein n=1 Tax=Kitasatospora sp. NBC_00240 TaxID=2903567 RepID=UPI002254B42B|nr:hypothetical protein [Kitasatospora sp. NBC_00240]MCX5215707.1 hypothetical protein [Kitasatospora sp. NBC_00240]